MGGGGEVDLGNLVFLVFFGFDAGFLSFSVGTVGLCWFYLGFLTFLSKSYWFT